MRWRHIQERLPKAQASSMRRQEMRLHSPGIPSDIPPLPPNRESPDIVVPPQFPPREPPEKLPPRVPPPPRPEPPRAPPRSCRTAGNRAFEVRGGRGNICYAGAASYTTTDAAASGYVPTMLALAVLACDGEAAQLFSRRARCRWKKSPRPSCPLRSRRR